MVKNYVFTIAGSKGGVGKTTTSINLGACLAEAGYATAVVEVDLPMANLVDFVDLDLDVSEATTLHDVLAGDAPVGEAVYDVDDRLAVVPSGTDLDGYAEADVDRLEPALEHLRWHFDVMILDTPAGLSEAVIKPIEVGDETVLISTPRVSSVRNVRNTKEVAERADTEIRGLVLSKSGTGASPGAERIAGFLDLDLLGHVPEDDAVPHSQDQGEPVVLNAPNSGAAIAYRKIAAELVDTDSISPTDPAATDAAGTDGSPSPSARNRVATSDGGQARTAEPDPEPTDDGVETTVQPDSPPDPTPGDSADEDGTDAAGDPTPAITESEPEAEAETETEAGTGTDRELTPSDVAAEVSSDDSTGSSGAATPVGDPEPVDGSADGTDAPSDDPDGTDADSGPADADDGPDVATGTGPADREDAGVDPADEPDRTPGSDEGTDAPDGREAGTGTEAGEESAAGDDGADEDASIGARIRSAIGL